MTVLVAIEASQPDGTVYRVAIGWTLHSLASWIAGFGRLF
jgi:hypothetical protein